MTTRAKLLRLRALMLDEQRALLMQAAEAGTIPTGPALARIADLESAILAVEAMIDEAAGVRAA